MHSIPISKTGSDQSGSMRGSCTACIAYKIIYMHTHLVFHDCCQRSDNQHNRGLTRGIQLVVHERKARKTRALPEASGPG